LLLSSRVSDLYTVYVAGAGCATKEQKDEREREFEEAQLFNVG
jgi:hypothetical protein